MISKRTLLNALQKAQLDAFQLLNAEFKHHALCWRSIGTVPYYAELLQKTLKPSLAKMDQVAKSQLVEGLERVLINLDSAKIEIQANYNSVIRRTVIVFADIVENQFESTIGICLLHLDPAQTSIREITTFKRQAETERQLKQAVRKWESSLSAPARTQRIEHMVKAFFPTFAAPQDFEFLDRLFLARNQFTHELIRLSEEEKLEAPEIWTLAKVDQAYDAASGFLIAVMASIPGGLQTPISVSVAE
jgi:hypothetical protein